jgi:hypothetical protein
MFKKFSCFLFGHPPPPSQQLWSVMFKSYGTFFFKKKTLAVLAISVDTTKSFRQNMRELDIVSKYEMYF